MGLNTVKMNSDHLPGRNLRIGIIDTGVNPWNSRVQGRVRGSRLYLNTRGEIVEDEDFRDRVGHGTDVAAILRQGLAGAELFVVRVFGADFTTYPSLVARGILRAVSEGCALVNLSLGMEPAAGSELLVEACAIALKAGCVLVAADNPQRQGILPASLPGVIKVVADEGLAPGRVRAVPGSAHAYAACGWARDPGMMPPANVWGHSFASAWVARHLALGLADE